jgi:hypothetical protein
MVDFAVDNHTGIENSLALVAAAIETKLESIVNTKVIRLLEVYQIGNQWGYCLILTTPA